MRLTRFQFMLAIGLVLTALWLLLAARYVTSQVGWSNLFFMLPHEIGAFFAGVFAPLAFLWLVIVALGARARVSDAAEAIGRRLDALIYPVANAEEKTNAVIGAIEAGNARMMEATNRAAAEAEGRIAAVVQDFETRFAAGADAIAAAAVDADRHLREAGEALAREAGALSVATGDATTHIEAVRQAFESENRDLRAAADKVAKEMHALGALFRQRSREIEIASDEAQDRVAEAGRDLQGQTQDYTSALGAASERAGEIVATFKLQTEELLSASRIAADEAAKVRLNSLDAERDRFLRASRLIIEELNSLGVDLTRLMDKPLAEKMWKQFARGDKSVFLRGILADVDARKINATICTAYENDSDFRKYADHYLELFENLLAQATVCDPESLLSSAFVTADVGKVYVLLSRAVGRMN